MIPRLLSFSAPPTWSLPPSSEIVAVHGRPGVGKSRLASALVARQRHLYVEAASLPDAGQRSLLLASARMAGLPDVPSPGDVPDADARWGDIVPWLAGQGVETVVFDGLGSLLDGNRKFVQEVALAWTQLATEGAGLRLIFLDEDRDVLDKLIKGRGVFGESPLGFPDAASSATVDFHRVDPLGYDAVARHCPGWSAEDVLAGYSVFGGLPGVLRWVDPSLKLGANVVRLVLDPDGPLASRPLDYLRGRFQGPARYGAIVRGLARGADTWRGLAASVPDLPGVSPLAPYLRRLEALDLVRVRRSLDSAPGSRRRRYRLSDPFDQFWWSHVLPLRSSLVSGVLKPQRAWDEHVEPVLDEHVARVFPSACRHFLATYGLGLSGASAREVGALWGERYEIPVAGTLENGWVVYGECHWHQRRPTEASLARLQEQVRATRYGIGRETRVRLLFTREQPKERLAQALLRSELIQRVGPIEMVAAARRGSSPA